MMLYQGAIFLYGLLSLVIWIGQSALTVTSGNITAQISYMTSLCAGVSLNNLGLCNTTCVECSVSNLNDCSTCTTGYTLVGKYCVLDNSISTYTYHQYAGQNLHNDLASIGSFRYTKNNELLNVTSILSSCENSPNQYQFVSAGLFKKTDQVEITFALTDPIDKIQIKLNFKSLVADMKFFITLNDNVIFSRQFTQFTDLSGNYTTDSVNYVSRNFLELPGLFANTKSIWIQVDSTLIDYIAKDFTLKFYVQSNSTQTYVWGFHDMVILQRNCETCVSQAVQTLINNTGAAILVTLAIVVVLVVILFVAIKVEEWRRKVAFQKKLGSSASSLPTKAINRVIDAIKGVRKNREKEWNSDAKKFQKAKAKISSRRQKSVANQ